MRWRFFVFLLSVISIFAVLAQEVCAEYGFANYSTFYRAYVKYFGVSPSKTEKGNLHKIFSETDD